MSPLDPSQMLPPALLLPAPEVWANDCCYGYECEFEDEGDDDEGWCDTCQNTGSVDCHCGGDLCVCDNGGEFPCPNCDRGW